MRKIVLVASIVAVLLISLSLSVPVCMAGSFNDTDTHWAREQIEQAISDGWVFGYGDGTFRPDNPVTRAEFITILNRAFNLTQTASINFVDVKPTDWFYEEIQKAKAANIITGYEDNTFRPDNPITREEAASIIVKIENLQPVAQDMLGGFKDSSEVSGWSKQFINTAVYYNLIKGYPDYTIGPKNLMTRAESVIVLSRTLNLRPVSQPTSASTESPNGNLTLMVSSDVVNIRTGPGTQYDVITQVKIGDLLSVIDKSGDWYKVKLQNGTVGWIAGWLTTVYDNPTQTPGDTSDGLSDGERLRDSDTVSSRGNVGQAALLPYEGKGAWYSIYSTMPTPDDLSRFANAGVTHVYVEVATSKAGFPDKWKQWLDYLLPLAHRAGIKVIAWLYTDLKDTTYDASLTAQVANYVTPSGYRVDGVAADIEELPQKDPITASKIVEDYASQAIENLPAGMPFIAITYPPQYRPSFPYATMAKYFDAIALMDYWHVSDIEYTYDYAKNFVADSIETVQLLTGNNVDIEVVLHGYDAGYGLPSVDELKGALDASKSAVGCSVYTWNTLSNELKEVFTNY